MFLWQISLFQLWKGLELFHYLKYKTSTWTFMHLILYIDLNYLKGLHHRFLARTYLSSARGSWSMLPEKKCKKLSVPGALCFLAPVFVNHLPCSTCSFFCGNTKMDWKRSFLRQLHVVLNLEISLVAPLLVKWWKLHWATKQKQKSILWFMKWYWVQAHLKTSQELRGK